MENTSDSISNEVKDDWMIRPCDIYNEEYQDCKSIRARLHQYFVCGDMQDCLQWKRDYDNCNRCIFENNKEACEAVIESEKVRRLMRYNAHHRNDIWERRTEPPQNWNVPLPEKMQKSYESSYLDLKAKEMKNGETNRSLSRTLCVLS